MGELYRIEPETGLVLFGTPDALTYSAWEAAVLAVLASTTAPAARRRFLSDRRRTRQVQSLELVESIVEFFRRHAEMLGDMQWALLASSQSQIYGVLQLGESLTQSTRVRVKTFTDLKESLRWLLGAYDDEDLERLIRWVDRAP